MALYLQATIVMYVSMLAERSNELISQLHRDESGQDTLEWVLMGGLVAGAIVAVAVLFDAALVVMVGNISDCIDFASATACNPGF